MALISSQPHDRLASPTLCSIERERASECGVRLVESDPRTPDLGNWCPARQASWAPGLCSWRTSSVSWPSPALLPRIYSLAAPQIPRPHLHRHSPALSLSRVLCHNRIKIRPTWSLPSMCVTPRCGTWTIQTAPRPRPQTISQLASPLCARLCSKPQTPSASSACSTVVTGPSSLLPFGHGYALAHTIFLTVQVAVID